MGYVEKALNKGESIVAKANHAWTALLPAFLWLVIDIALAFATFDEVGADKAGSIIKGFWLALGILPSLIKLLELLLMEFVITDRRVIGKTGVIKRDSIDMPIHKVDNVEVKTTFFGRIFGYSKIVVKSASGKKEFKNIAKAEQFKNKITEAIEQAAEKERIAQAETLVQALKTK